MAGHWRKGFSKISASDNCNAWMYSASFGLVQAKLKEKAKSKS